MNKLLAAALFALTMGFTAVAAQPERAPDDKKATEKKPPVLEGGYTLVSGEKDGKAIPEADIKGALVRITDTNIVGTDKDKKELFAGTYTLDTGKTPWTMTMTSKDKSGKEVTAQGIVKKDGDTVTIIYALPGGEAPKEFKTKDRQHLFVLKNTGKDTPKDPNKFTKD